MKGLAIIPARAGSKRLPNKNRLDFEGVPLWRRAVTQAQLAEINHVFVSTDDQMIVQQPDDQFVRLERPADLAGDSVGMLPVVLHALQYAQPIFGTKPPFVCVLQPTSPLRWAGDIWGAIRMFNDSGADSVVSVTEGPNDLAFMVRHARRLERLPNIVVPNGAIYIVRTSVLEAGGDWYSGEVYGFPMAKERSVDIDTQLDLDLARFYLERAT